MHIRQANNKQFLVCNKSEFLAIGKQAGWLGDYWKGLQSVRDIRKQTPTNRGAYWNAFQSVQGIGQGLSQYKQNLTNDFKTFQQIQRFATTAQHLQTNPTLQKTMPQLNPQAQLQRLYDQLSPTGQQIFNQAIQNTKALVNNSEIQIQHMSPVAKEAERLTQEMLTQASQSQNLDFQRPDAWTPEAFGAAEKIINQVLQLPTGIQYKIVAKLTEALQNNPDLTQSAPV